MKVYAVRDTVSKELFKELNSVCPRVYSSRGQAFDARIGLTCKLLKLYRDVTWYDLTHDEFSKAIEQLTEVVEFDAVEVQK